MSLRVILGGIGLLCMASLLGGCVGQGEYDRLFETNRSLTARNAELTRERDEARAQVDLMRRSVGDSAGTLSDLQKRNAELQRLLDEAQGDYRSLNDRIGALQIGPLDAQTDQALAALAAQFPDLIKYDASRGMLRFAADLTFDSGSDAVRADAKQAIGALAQILNSSSAGGYEVVVEGHTDSQRISSRTATKHATNRHLSAHRAISVIDELMKLGVDPARMMAAGWGELRPAVQNNANGNTPQNRRVEIFLVKSTGAPAITPPAPLKDETRPTTLAPSREQPPARPVDISK